jgi:hypothetical protein
VARAGVDLTAAELWWEPHRRLGVAGALNPARERLPLAAVRHPWQ